MNWISAIFGAISSVFGWITNRSALNNSTEMRDRAAAQKQNDSDDLGHRIIKNGNESDIKNDLS